MPPGIQAAMATANCDSGFYEFDACVKPFTVQPGHSDDLLFIETILEDLGGIMNRPKLHLTIALCLIHGAAFLAIAQPAAAAELGAQNPLGSSSNLFPDIPDIFFPPFPNALELDVQNNDAYSQATKSILADQIQSDFEEFDGLGKVPGSTAPSPKPTGLPPFGTPPLELRVVTVEDPYEFTRVAESCVPLRECELPLDYNVSSSEVRLIWAFRDGTVRNRFIQHVGLSQDRKLVVELNGDPLIRRPAFGFPNRLTEYSASVETGSNCRPALLSSCLVIEVNRRGWFDGPAPWTPWLVTVKGIYSPFGQLFPTVEYVAGRVVTPKDQVKDFFTATVAKSTMSQRCTTCHQLDDESKLIAQHSSGGVGVGSVSPAASIVNDNEVINVCSNCHESGLPLDFAERRWATPTPPQDINWAEIINAETDAWPMEICDRIVGNLETFSERREHFHEDARLFWAVADGVTPFGDQLATAHPKDYDEFLDHFDAWNISGAPCPEPVPEPGFTVSLLIGGLLVASQATRRNAR